MLAPEMPSGWGVTAGDFDGDGDIDFAATGKNPGRVAWYETRFNQPAVEHFLYLVGGGARYITSADFDNDGDIDLIVSGYGEDRFILFENRGTEYPDRFEIQSLLEDVGGAWQAIPLDVDGNGTSDVAACGYNDNSVNLLLTTPQGEHTPLTTVMVDDPIGLFAVDYDRDGDMDLLIASSSQTAGGIYYLEQTSPLQFNLQGLFIESGFRLTSVCAADLDNDGDIDPIATHISTNDGVAWWEHTNNGLIRHYLGGYTYLPRNAVVADFDDDNLIDIAATWHGASPGSGGLYWWKNHGNGSFSYAVIHDGESPYDLQLIDFDLDGDEDLITPLSGRGEVVLFRNMLGISALIQGVVTSEAEGLPLRNILVTVRETGTSDLTDSTGAYLINVAPGFYTIDIKDDCWEDRQFEAVAAIEDSIRILDVGLRAPVLNVDRSSLNLQVYNGIETSLPMTVRNLGDAALAIHAEVMEGGVADEWLSISPVDITIQPGEGTDFTVSITPDTIALGAWDYYGEIILHSNACPDTVLEIPAFVHVLDAQETTPALPTQTGLRPVYPNPFNASTRIRFDLSVPEHVELSLFDVQGRLVSKLLSAFTEAGSHELEFDGHDLASGLYFLRMTAGQNDYTQKLHLLK